MTALRRALVTMAVVALAGGLITIPVSVGSNHVGPRGLFLAQQLLIGWSFVGTGLFMWWRRPENRLGMLMTALISVETSKAPLGPFSRSQRPASAMVPGTR